MPDFSSKTLWQERSRLADEQRVLLDEGKTDEARVLEGQIKQLDVTLEDIIEYEDKMRQVPSVKTQAVNMAEALLGPRNEFNGLEVGFKNDAATVLSVTGPQEIELTLDAKLAPVTPDFASTLIETPASGSVSYKQRGPQVGAVGTRTITNGKSAAANKVVYSWVDAVANKEACSGYVPVSKDTLADYDELTSIIMNDLMLDIAADKDAKYLKGSNTSGIVGVTNTTGIQTFTDGMAGMYFDAIRKMRTKVVKNARRVPTHVAMSPEIKEAIDLYKTETGLYQSLGDNVYWGMQVIEDVNIDGIVCYDFRALASRIIHPLSIEVGYIESQFIERELSILGDEMRALQVRYPDAICYATATDLKKAAA